MKHIEWWFRKKIDRQANIKNQYKKICSANKKILFHKISHIIEMSLLLYLPNAGHARNQYKKSFLIG